LREHNGEFLGDFGSGELAAITRVQLEDMTEKKDAGVERWVLSGGRDVLFDRQMGEVGFNFFGTHGTGFARQFADAFENIGK